MTWFIAAGIGLTIMALAARFATTVRDHLQDSLAHRRKLKASDSRNDNRLLLFLLLPLILYILLGTVLLLLLSGIEEITKKLRDYWGVPNVEVIAWHQVSLFLTLLFPVAWPITALMVGCVFIGALLLAIVKTAQKVLANILGRVRKLWVRVIHGLQALLEGLAERLRWVWELVVDGIQTSWDMVVDSTQRVTEQITAFIRNVWTTISNTIHS